MLRRGLSPENKMLVKSRSTVVKTFGCFFGMGLLSSRRTSSFMPNKRA